MSAEERHIEVARTARYWMLGSTVDRPAELWIVLHGYKQLARRFIRRFQPLDDGSRWILAPEALNRFYAGSEPGRHGPTAAVGATWMTREDRLHEIRDYVGYLDTLAGETLQGLPEGTPVTVLGFSQGVATAARWATFGNTPLTRLILWGDFLPPDLPLDEAVGAWADTDVVLARGDRDPVFGDESLASAEAERLAGSGLVYRRVEYSGGHDIEQRALQALAASPSSAP